MPTAQGKLAFRGKRLGAVAMVAAFALLTVVCGCIFVAYGLTGRITSWDVGSKYHSHWISIHPALGAALVFVGVCLFGMLTLCKLCDALDAWRERPQTPPESCSGCGTDLGRWPLLRLCGACGARSVPEGVAPCGACGAASGSAKVVSYCPSCDASHEVGKLRRLHLERQRPPTLVPLGRFRDKWGLRLMIVTACFMLAAGMTQVLLVSYGESTSARGTVWFGIGFALFAACAVGWQLYMIARES